MDHVRRASESDDSLCQVRQFSAHRNVAVLLLFDSQHFHAWKNKGCSACSFNVVFSVGVADETQYGGMRMIV